MEWRRWKSQAMDRGRDYVMICTCGFRSEEFATFYVHLKKMHRREVDWPSASYGNLMRWYAWVPVEGDKE